jgi:hypothetical protein
LEAETKAVTSDLANAMAVDDDHPELLKVVSDTYHEHVPSVDKVVKQYQSVKGSSKNCLFPR